MTALLVLEDGRAFAGDSYGAEGESFGEAVFNTGMTGYQETLTDPSYHRQIVVQTAPHIGNTGVNDADAESDRIWVSGYVVREPARQVSSWRAEPVAGAGAAQLRRGRHQRRRHPGADPAPARAGCHAGGHLDHRPGPGFLAGKGDCLTADGRRRPHRRGQHRRAVPGGRARRAPVQHCRAGLRDQGDDPAPVGRTRHHQPRVAGRARRPSRCWPPVPTRCSCPTDRATRPPPSTRSAWFASCSAGASRSSASASATRSWAGRSGWTPTSCATAIAGSTNRWPTWPPARWRSPRTTTASRCAGRPIRPFRLPTPTSGRSRSAIVCLNDQVVEGLRARDVPAFSVQYHPEAAAGPHDAAYLFDRFAELLDDQGRGSA